VIALDDQFHGIPEGSQLFHLEVGAPDEAHLQESPADGTLSLDLQHGGFLSGLEVAQVDLLIVRHILNSIFKSTVSEEAGKTNASDIDHKIFPRLLYDERIA
jgi:hypothetical protein